MDDVELVQPPLEEPRGSEAECQWFRKPPGPHRPDLEQVDGVAILSPVRRTERVGLSVEVEARDSSRPHPLVKLGVGLAGEHLHVVAERDELAGQIADVHALAAAVRFAPVGQQGHAEAPPRTPWRC